MSILLSASNNHNRSVILRSAKPVHEYKLRILSMWSVNPYDVTTKSIY